MGGKNSQSVPEGLCHPASISHCAVGLVRMVLALHSNQGMIHRAKEQLSLWHREAWVEAWAEAVAGIGTGTLTAKEAQTRTAESREKSRVRNKSQTSFTLPKITSHSQGVKGEQNKKAHLYLSPSLFLAPNQKGNSLFQMSVQSQQRGEEE